MNRGSAIGLLYVGGKAAKSPKSEVSFNYLATWITLYLTRADTSPIVSQMDNQLDTFFAAMADPTRRAVIERLAQGPASVTDLHDPGAMALPSFLKHVNRLESAGLIRSEKTGRTRILNIEAAPLAQAEDWLARQRRLWEGKLDRLQALAEAMERRKP